MRRPGSQASLIAAYVALAAGIVLPAAKTFPPKVRLKARTRCTPRAACGSI
jgi:hypothetical protein